MVEHKEENFTVKMVQHRNSFPGEAVDDPCLKVLKVLKISLDGALMQPYLVKNVSMAGVWAR